MKGLILKDLITLKSYGKSLLMIFLLFLVLGLSSGSPLSGAMMVMPISIMAAYVTFSYDKLSNWDCYANTMPLKRKDIVLARYAVTLILCLLFFIASLFSYLFSAVIMHDFSELNLILPTYCVLMGIIMILVSLILVLNYKVGPDKSRLALILIFIIPSILTAFLANSGISLPNISIDTLLLGCYLTPVLGCIVLMISYLISSKIYEHKEF